MTLADGENVSRPSRCCIFQLSPPRPPFLMGMSDPRLDHVDRYGRQLGYVWRGGAIPRRPSERALRPELREACFKVARASVHLWRL
jgi:hypothetical protein